jgi:membrane fusion protein, multidrug efflux system
MNIRKILTVGIPLLVILAGFGLMKFFGAQKQDPPKMPPVKPERFVKVESVVYSTNQAGIVAYGRIISANAINLVAEASGRINAGDVSLKPAQVFKKGQLLYKIDDTEAKLALQAQKSDFINAVAGVLPDIRIDYNEFHKEWEQYLSKIEMMKPLPVYPNPGSEPFKIFLSARGILNRYYSIKSAEERIDKHVFRAPYDGSISEVRIETGSVVNPGTQIGRIIRTDEMEAEIPVRSEFIKFIEKGIKVKLYSQDRSISWEGRIARIADFVDPATQSINVYITLKNDGAVKIVEGFYLMAEIPGKAMEGTMELPRRALVGDSQVFVVKEGKLSLKEVNIQKLTPETFFFSGLREGEKVVAESLVNATEGMSVTPIDNTDVQQ